MSTINERVKLIMEIKEENPSSLGKKIGTSRQSVTNIITDVNKPSYDFIDSLIEVYPDISTEYLLRGVEPMLLGKVQEYTNKSDKKEESQSVPLYDFEASAGLMKLFTSKPNILEHITIPNLPKCDGAIHVSGDSMYPLLKSGDIVIYKQVHDIQGAILFGNMYLISCIIDGEDYTLVKYIHESDQGREYVKLVSQNQYHKPIEVLRDNILALAYIKASIRINSMS